MTPRRTQQITAAENVRAQLCDAAPDMAGKVNQLKERPLREFVTTPPEHRVEVLKSAVSLPGKLTTRKIQVAKSRVLDAETHEPVDESKCCPTCGRKLP